MRLRQSGSVGASGWSSAVRRPEGRLVLWHAEAGGGGVCSSVAQEEGGGVWEMWRGRCDLGYLSFGPRGNGPKTSRQRPPLFSHRRPDSVCKNSDPPSSAKPK